MKLLKNKMWIIMCILLLGMGMLSACGKGNSNSDIVGTWISTENSSKFIFNSDGTWMFDANCPAQGTWEITEGKENEIQMPSQSGLGQDMWHVGGVHEYSIKDNILNIEGVGEFEKE